LRPQTILVCVSLAAALGVAAVIERGRLLTRHAPAEVDNGLKQILEPKIQAEWTAFEKKDAQAYHDLLADDFIAVEVDSEGTRNKQQATDEIQHSGVTDVTLSRLDVRSLAADAAMVTYEAFLTFIPSAQVRFLRIYVTEIWVRKGDVWEALHYQETRVR
jgi:ketosteroid isomerase-like protein